MKVYTSTASTSEGRINSHVCGCDSTRLYTCLVLLPHSAGFGDCRAIGILIPASLGERFISESLEFIIPRRRNSLYAADALPKFYSYAGSIVQV